MNSWGKKRRPVGRSSPPPALVRLSVVLCLCSAACDPRVLPEGPTPLVASGVTSDCGADEEPDQQTEPVLPCDPNEKLSGLPDRPVLGRPVSLDVSLEQGPRTLFTTHINANPCDPMDGAEPYYNRIVEEYVYYPGCSNASIYLVIVVSDPNAEYSNFQFYFRAAKRSDFRKKANNPLFCLDAEDRISLRVERIRFENNGHPRRVSVFHYPYGELAAAVYMLHYGEYDSSYYALPFSQVFDAGPGNTTLQVPMSAFMDHDPNYWFQEDSGDTPSVVWANMSSPAPDPNGDFPAMRIDGTPVARNGEVFEMCVGAVGWLMEPGGGVQGSGFGDP
jgi:hypothetical protein